VLSIIRAALAADDDPNQADEALRRAREADARKQGNGGGR
jgi:hypothetical protein